MDEHEALSADAVAAALPALSDSVAERLVQILCTGPRLAEGGSQSFEDAAGLRLQRQSA